VDTVELASDSAVRRPELVECVRQALLAIELSDAGFRGELVLSAPFVMVDSSTVEHSEQPAKPRPSPPATPPGGSVLDQLSDPGESPKN
jgi:hypothetical protein